MLFQYLPVAALAAGVANAQTKTTLITKTTAAPAATPAAGNPFSGYGFYANPYYASEVSSLAIPSLPASLVPAASAVANIGSFTWLDTRAKVPTMDTYLADIRAKNQAGQKLLGQFVVYDLPDRDCAALASNGELSIANNGSAIYKAQYIDQIASIIKKYPDVQIILAIEPDSLGNLVTNTNVQKCANAANTYKDDITYALKTLNFPNVNMYIDGGHAGWLGWPANITPAAQLFGQIFKAAGSPKALRGIVTNVSNYNPFRQPTGTCPAITSPNANCDEEKYINALAPLLVQNGFPAHFIVDTSRNGHQPTGQVAWGDWCNVKNTGFGARPGTNTGNQYVDAFVWVKPGGEADGTSNTTSPRYDATCGKPAALQPAPEAGTWFQAYFQQLLQNANPSF